MVDTSWILIFVVILTVILIYMNQNTISSLSGFTITSIGRRPVLGDYLPIVGEVPIGEDSRVLEADAY